MPKDPRFNASIYQIVSDAIAASEEQLSTVRGQVLDELERLRREAVEEARDRVLAGQEAADALRQAAAAEADDLRELLSAATADAQREVARLDEGLRIFRERLDDITARLHGMPVFELPGEAAAMRAPDESAAGAAEAAEGLREPAEHEEPPGVAALAEAVGHPPAPQQRRLAFGSAETRLAAAALTSAAADKLDLVDELVLSPNFSAEERSLSLLVLLREAEQLTDMAGQFGRPPTELTERLLELRRRVTRLLHGQDPLGD